MYDLQGQVALVTGAGGEHGIGYAIARRLAEEGADVVVNDVSARPYPDAEWGGLDAAVAAIEGLGRRSACVVADVGDPEQVDRMVSETVEKMGPHRHPGEQRRHARRLGPGAGGGPGGGTCGTRCSGPTCAAPTWCRVPWRATCWNAAAADG